MRSFKHQSRQMACASGRSERDATARDAKRVMPQSCSTCAATGPHETSSAGMQTHMLHADRSSAASRAEQLDTCGDGRQPAISPRYGRNQGCYRCPRCLTSRLSANIDGMRLAIMPRPSAVS